MALALDASTPAFVHATANPAVTASFSPPAASLLIAFTIGDVSNTWVVSGGGLTWTKIDALSPSGVNSVSTWWAYAVSAPGPMTVSAQRTGSYNANALKVLVFTGAESGFTGAHLAAQSYEVSLTATATGSWVWAVIGDQLGKTNDIAISGCVYNDAEISFGGISGGILKRTTADGVSGSPVLIGASTAPQDMSIAAVEIKPSSGGGPTYSGTGVGALTLAATGSGVKAATGGGSGAVSLAAAATGLAARSGTGSAALALTAGATGTKHTSGTDTGNLTLAASATGASQRSGTSSAALTLTASAPAGGSGLSGTGTAAITLTADSTGTAHRVGTGTAALHLSATGGTATPARDVDITIGPSTPINVLAVGDNQLGVAVGDTAATGTIITAGASTQTWAISDNEVGLTVGASTL